MPRNSAPLGAQNGIEATQGQIGERDVIKQETKATEQKQDSKRQNKTLDNRYGKIGISAVAAALRHQGEQQSIGEYRIPFDRD